MPVYAIPTERGQAINAIYGSGQQDELHFLFSEVATVFSSGTTIPNALRKPNRAAAKSPHSAVAAARQAITGVKAAGVHNELVSAGLLLPNDYSTKVIPGRLLSELLLLFDPNGACEAQDIVKAAAEAHTPCVVVETVKATAAPAKKPRVRIQTNVPRLQAPIPYQLELQRTTMRAWATDATALRTHPSFKGGMQTNSFDSTFNAGPSAFMAFMHNEKRVPLNQLQFSISGTCSTFNKESLEAFDEYCRKVRGQDAFRSRAQSMKGLIVTNKWLIRDRPFDPLKPTQEESFLRAMSAKCTALQREADKTPKPLPEATPKWVDAPKCRRRCISILRQKWKSARVTTAKAKMKRAVFGRQYMINAFFTLDSTKRSSAIRKLKLHPATGKQVIKLKKSKQVQLEYKGSGSYKTHKFHGDQIQKVEDQQFAADIHEYIKVDREVLLKNRVSDHLFFGDRSTKEMTPGTFTSRFAASMKESVGKEINPQVTPITLVGRH